MSRALVIAALVATGTSGATAESTKPSRLSQFVIDYVAPVKRGVVGAPQDHLATMRQLSASLERELKLKRALKINYKECGTANSYYHPDNTIEICHELWDQRRQLYRASGLGEKAREVALRGAMTFTFFHELGHALHRELALPLVGRWEDAVDEIATITMIGRGLGDQAAQAALSHYLRSRQPAYNYDVTDEHSPAGSRGVAIACLLYGSAAERYGWLVKTMNISEKRLSRCAREYQYRAATWATLLKSKT